jgi:hypothetical protein
MASDPLAAITDELVLGIATDLLRFPSTLGEEGPAGESLAARMRALGYEVHLQEVVARRYNVVGIVRGHGGGQNLLLNGHLDVPLPVVGWTRDPWAPAVEDGWLYGNGVTDMKGGTAAIVAADWPGTWWWRRSCTTTRRASAPSFCSSRSTSPASTASWASRPTSPSSSPTAGPATSS